ncbi:MAG: hypothetical protein ACLFU9_03515 [Candidatus Bathyarchaeia archaeon]
MKAKIALATVSGKAYYLLASELKKKKASFLSLTPDDHIPVDVKLVITTKRERHKIMHENVLEYDEGKSPADVVDEAIRIVKGKRVYERLIIGVDPGQSFGVAILGDGGIVETKTCNSVHETLAAIKEVLARIPAAQITVRVGDGAPLYAEEFVRRLLESLPENATTESVSEEGTSRFFGEGPHRREGKDIGSAIKIAQRQGKVLLRRKSND